MKLIKIKLIDWKKEFKDSDFLDWESWEGFWPQNNISIPGTNTVDASNKIRQRGETYADVYVKNGKLPKKLSDRPIVFSTRREIQNIEVNEKDFSVRDPAEEDSIKNTELQYEFHIPLSSSYIAFVDKDYGWGVGGSDQFKQIVPVIGADVTVDNPHNRNYSAGLVVLNYGNGTIGIVKSERVWTQDAWGIKIVVYDRYTGQYIETLVTCNDLSNGEYDVFPQTVNISPDGLELWFSYTNIDNFENDCWMKCTRASTEEAFGQPIEQFKMPGAWKVLWDNSGEIWFAGKDLNPWSDPACIYRGMALTKKVSIDGYLSFSAGFAFDDFGNLWVGTYTDSGPATQQYLLVFNVDKLNNSGVLGIEDADVTYEMPILENEGVSYFTGVSDIAYADGYMYISANGGYKETYNTEVNCILRIPTHAGTDKDPFAMQEELEIIYTVDPTIDLDWLKAIGVGQI